MKVLLNVPARRRFLEAATLGVVALNRVIMGRTYIPPLYQSGVRYRAEEPGQENWRTADDVYTRGFGDCEDLATWRAAELQLRGELAGVDIKRSGFRRFHARVRRASGRIEDPSKLLGMKGRS